MKKALSRFYNGEKRKTKAYKMARELTEFYASHPVSDWQRARVQDIRDLHEKHQEKLAIAHDLGSSRVSEQYMEFELDYLRASHEFREKNPRGSEMPWSPEGGVGFLGRVFVKNLLIKAKNLGLSMYGKEAEAK